MRALLLCCLVALAVCQDLSFELNLNPKNIYEYSYEGYVKIGLGKPGRAESGVRMKSTVKIIGYSADTFLLQFSHVSFEEFNGIPGKSDFVKAQELTQKITAQLAKPITFRYSAGNVGEIRASATEVTDTVVNIIRGFLGFFQVTIKTTQEIYELEEVGIHGKCLSSYAVKTNDRERVMDLTQVVDVTHCREKAAFYSGLATAVEDKVSKQRGDSYFSTVKYTYSLQGNNQGGVITKAQAEELQYSTPFNVKKGSFRMEAKKELLLISVTSKTQEIHHEGQMDSRGGLMYKIVKDNANIPVVMQKLDNPVSKATELIKRLAKANEQHIDSATTEDAIKLYQLLRKIPYPKLMKMWGNLKGNVHERRWFLHTVVEVNDDKILHFLDQYLHTSDFNTTIEAITVIVQAFNHLEASSPELLSLAATKFLNKDYPNLIKQTLVLSYGSLVFRHCAYHTPCPIPAILPLTDMAHKLHSGDDEMEKILVLKALGNAGHPYSLKNITRFLPGVDPNPDKVDKRPRVVGAAVQAMRLITVREPHRVQVNTLKLFLNRELEAELRMLAFMIMFDTKPSMALVSTVTAHLLDEKDMHVVNFAYTYLRRLARATTPDNHYLSTAASVAVKILAPKFGHLSYIQSRAIRMDWFHDDYLIGTATEAFILKRASQIMPAEMMVKQNFYFIGRILQLLEFNIRPEGLRDLLGANIPGFNGDMSMTDFWAVYDVLKKWETLPEEKPVFSFYTRASGQEFFFGDFSKECLKRLMKSFSESAGNDTLLWKMIEEIIKGFSFVLPFLTAEVRYIQATTLGLPMEISKYYHVVNGMAVNAQAGVQTQHTKRLGELLTSGIPMNGYIGYTKNLWFFYGINTDMFQSAVEIKTTNPVAIPLNFVAKVDITAKKFELEIPLSSKETELFSIRSDAYAISRNIIDPEALKKSPIVRIDQRDQSVSQKYSHVMLKYQPNRWHPVENTCYESSTYGISLCTEMELKREYYLEEYPLYYFLGYTHYAVKVRPSSVTKIRLEIIVEPSSSSVNVDELIDALRNIVKEAMPSIRSTSQEQQDRPSRGIGPKPLVRVQVLAEGSRGQKGYKAELYHTCERERTQLIMSYVGDSSNWKMCMEAAKEIETQVQVLAGWGDKCQNYTMFMRAEQVTDQPGIKAFFHWGKMPLYMEQYGRRIARYIPGMAYLMGFNQEEKENKERVVSASVIAVSADSIDVKIEFPEFTLCHEALPSPLPPDYFLYSDKTINRNTQA